MKAYRIVLIGAQAMGKTTFFNNITNSNEKTSYSGKSCTRQLVQGTAAYGEGFEVIDTPGFDSQEDKLNHAAGIIAALTYGTVHRILIVIKYDRDDYMYRFVSLCLKAVYRFKSIITIVITHFDQCKQNKNAEKIRVQEFIKGKFKIDSILFYSQQEDAEIICFNIQQILISTKPQDYQQIKLMESEIYSSMDLLELIDFDQETQLTTHRTQILKEFRIISRSYIQFINKLQETHKLYLEILHQIILKIKEEGNRVVEQFEQKHCNTIQQLVDIYGNNLQYLHYICLKKEIKADIENVIQVAQEKMRKNEKHFYNFLKKCPHCNQVWLKVLGCENETYCGKRANSNFDFSILNRGNDVRIQRNKENIIDLIVNEGQNIQTEQDQQKEYLINYILQDSEIKKQKLLEYQVIQLLEDLYPNNFIEKIIQESKQGLFRIEDLIQKIIQCSMKKMSGIQIFYATANMQQQQNTQNNSSKGVGCGKLIDWKIIKPLSEEEIKTLLSPELFDYFADQDQIEQQEIKWLNANYKKILQESIEKHQGNIVQAKKGS